MKKNSTIIMALLAVLIGHAQDILPIDTSTWQINSNNYIIENYKGEPAIYLKGTMALKEVEFLNGTIEFDLFLRKEWGFPGIYFRSNGQNSEQFYFRPHLSGKPDANQAAPVTNGISPWQFYFGPKYSFPYEYKYDDWTHVKLVVNGDKAQVFLDYSERPHLSWNLFHETKAGYIVFYCSGSAAMYFSNISVNKDATELIDFEPGERPAIDGLVEEWLISDKFEETTFEDPSELEQLLKDRRWNNKIQVEEGTAANISRKEILYDGLPGNTVFAKLTITSDTDQTKLFDFGYSDRAVAILNGQPIYKGTNKWKSRDYRYLGTIGLFDSVYLNLKKGKNTLLLAVSEDFGGWLVTGKFSDPTGIKVKAN